MSPRNTFPRNHVPYNIVPFTLTYRKGLEEDIWIGGRDSGENTDFKWLWDDSVLNYTNWLDGDPDRGGITSDEHSCIRLRHSSGFNWADTACTESYRPLCMLPGKLGNKRYPGRQMPTPIRDVVGICVYFF